MIILRWLFEEDSGHYALLWGALVAVSIAWVNGVPHADIGSGAVWAAILRGMGAVRSKPAQ